MKRLLLSFLAASVVLFASPMAQGEGSADETRIALRDEFLHLINRDRVSNGLAPVLLDPESSAVAEAYCREQIRNRTTGHFTIDGLAPYMRYSFAGGNDAISENAAAWSAKYRFSNDELLDMLHRSERAMLAEVPPDDGHRRAILDPHATHVGIGLAWEGGEFRIAQEFVRHYVQWTRPLPRVAAEGQSVTGVGKPVAGYTIDAISVHFEPAPRPIPVSLANSLKTYGLPDRRRDYLPRLGSYRERRANGALYEIHEEYADGTRGDFSIANDGSFTFSIPFVDGPGIYTVVVWLRRPGDPTPISVSNISVRLEPGTYRSAANQSVTR